MSGEAPYFVTASAVSVGAGLGLFLGPHPERTGEVGIWRGGILLDEGTRNSLRLSSISAQEIAHMTSNILMIATMANAALVDGLLIPAARGDTDLVWQGSAAHALAFGLTLTLDEIVKRSSARARPFERECADDPQRPGCSGALYDSFFSGHTSVAFTSAGFSCAMHLSRGLYDDPAADGVACASSVAMATATGVLRILADRHYLSDVLVGAVIGFAIGYLVPLAVVPERSARQGEDGELAPSLEPTLSLAPMVAPPTSTGGSTIPAGIGTIGINAFGTF